MRIPDDNITDLTDLYEMCENDVNSVRQMLRLFLISVPEDVNALNEAFKNQDFIGIKHISHRLESSVNLFNIETVKNEVRAIKNYAHEQENIQMISELIPYITTTLRKATIEIEKKLEKLNEQN